VLIEMESLRSRSLRAVMGSQHMIWMGADGNGGARPTFLAILCRPRAPPSTRSGVRLAK
jgi:hypothetical protein